MTESLTRRQAVIGLGAAGFVVAGARDARADLKALEASATKEGAVTWYTGQVDAEKAEKLGKAFTARYPGIRVSVIRTTGQVAYQRLLLEIKNKTPQCDMFSTTDISHMPALKERKELLGYTPTTADGLVPAFATLSDPGWWYVTNASRYFLMYNTNKIKPADLPKTMEEFAQKKEWAGRVAIDFSDNEWLIGSGKALDPEKYFIVVVCAFGNGQSSSPSNHPSQGGSSFPDRKSVV
jgi:iron(III) transport system substrate-binding protein